MAHLRSELKERVNEYLDISLSDTAKLRMLKNDLEYTPLEFFCSENADGSTESFDSQAYLIQKARDDYRRASELREEEEARQAELARIERMKAAEEEERKAREEAEAKEAAEEACRKAAAEAAELKAKAEAEAEAKAEAEAELAALKKAQQEAEAQRIAAEKAAEQAEINIPRGLEEIEPGVAGPATKAAGGKCPKGRRHAHRAFSFLKRKSKKRQTRQLSNWCRRSLACGNALNSCSRVSLTSGKTRKQTKINLF